MRPEMIAIFKNITAISFGFDLHIKLSALHHPTACSFNIIFPIVDVINSNFVGISKSASEPDLHLDHVNNSGLS